MLTGVFLTGTCEGCGQSVRIFEEGPAPPAGPAPPTGEADSSGKDSPGSLPDSSGVACEECGTDLRMSPADEGGLEAFCSECKTTLTYVLRPEESTPTSYDSRPARREFREGGGEDRGSRARPCRQCGAPLRFTTGEDGSISGECASCGNRFTLPRRRDSDGGRGEWRGRQFGPGRGRGPARRPGEWTPRGRGPPRGGSRGPPRGRFSRDGDEDSTRRRRRKPSED
jgi:hypothetical protein